MGKFRDLTGQTFGYLEVLEQVEDKIDGGGRHRKCWRCRCHNCGGETIVTTDALTCGQQVSCGCYKKQMIRKLFTTHGKTNTRLYGVWCAMKNRCYNVNVPEYRIYGARGIKVCDEWRNDFMSFYSWAIDNGYDESAPHGQCTIDRIDVNGNYEPLNCRIATQLEQMQNTRANHYITYNNETLTLAGWSRRTGIRSEKIRDRIVKLGWTPERALTTK